MEGIRKAIDDGLLAHATACEQVKQERIAVKQADDLALSAIEAQEILQQIAHETEQRAHDKLTAVVSRCLNAVFDEPYVFRFVFERKRNKTEARPVLERDGMQLDPLDAAGGGVIDVAAFALRLACLVLSLPPKRRVLILDEPFKFLSSQYRERARQMVEALASEMAVQFVIVTHITELETGFVVSID